MTGDERSILPVPGKVPEKSETDDVMRARWVGVRHETAGMCADERGRDALNS